MIAPAQARIEALNGAARPGMPPARRGGTPENEASQPISHEVAVAILSLKIRSSRRAVRTFLVPRGGCLERTPPSLHSRQKVCRRPARAGVRGPAEPVRRRAHVEGSGFQAVPAGSASLVARVDHKTATDPAAVAVAVRARSRCELLARTMSLEQARRKRIPRVSQARLVPAAQNARTEPGVDWKVTVGVKAVDAVEFRDGQRHQWNSAALAGANGRF